MQKKSFVNIDPVAAEIWVVTDDRQTDWPKLYWHRIIVMAEWHKMHGCPLDVTTELDPFRGYKVAAAM